MVKYVIVGKCSTRGEGGSNENYNLNKHRNIHFFIATNCSPPPPHTHVLGGAQSRQLGLVET